MKKVFLFCLTLFILLNCVNVYYYLKNDKETEVQVKNTPIEEVKKGHSNGQAVVPVKIKFLKPSISIPVRLVGVDGKQRMEVPEGISDAGWLKNSVIPGERGVSLIAAHRDWGNKLGPFSYLEKMGREDRIEISFSNGKKMYFKFKRKKVVNTEKDPYASIDVKKKTTSQVVLISCTGRFNHTTENYNQRELIYLIPEKVKK
ncbi:class F sortase [Listeria aquatica]|uniref:class F sortase n=1 Tax=Listeria aquatica TaxID=1494960 RepID=UPI003F6EE050